MTTWKPVRLSAMHFIHVQHGATIVEGDGWQRPARYTYVAEEVEHAQNAVGICDVSPVGKLDIQGEDLDSFMDSAFPGIELPNIGSVSQYPAPGDSGIGVLTLARLADDEIMALTGPNQAPSVIQALGEDPEKCAHAVDVTSGLAGIRIAGPSAQQLLASITELDLDNGAFPNMSCAQIKAAEIHLFLVRVDLGGLQSYQLYFAREFGEYMWEALIDSGEPYDVKPIGIEAMARIGGE